MGNKWNEAHPERMKELRRRWKKEHPQEVKESKRRDVEAHPEKKRERDRRSHKAHPEKRTYYNAKARCEDRTDAGYKWYGARGIEFRFTSFEQFFAEVGPRPSGLTLDRKNNDGHYEPGNVRWATPKEQRANQRSAT